MKKIVKLLPVALALMFISQAAFAEASNTAKSELNITVPKFINITLEESSVQEASASFNDTYDQITLSTPMSAKFKVITNNPDEKVKLTATALADGSQVNALYGNDDSSLKIIFTNTGSDARAAKEGAVTNIINSPSKADNANAIAFGLTPSITPDKSSGANDPVAAKNKDNVEYTIVNGVYEFLYTVDTTAVAETFSTHDTDGTYKATLTLSQVSL